MMSKWAAVKSSINVTNATTAFRAKEAELINKPFKSAEEKCYVLRRLRRRKRRPDPNVMCLADKVLLQRRIAAQMEDGTYQPGLYGGVHDHRYRKRPDEEQSGDMAPLIGGRHYDDVTYSPPPPNGSLTETYSWTIPNGIPVHDVNAYTNTSRCRDVTSASVIRQRCRPLKSSKSQHDLFYTGPTDVSLVGEVLEDGDLMEADVRDYGDEVLWQTGANERPQTAYRDREKLVAKRRITSAGNIRIVGELRQVLRTKKVAPSNVEDTRSDTARTNPFSAHIARREESDDTLVEVINTTDLSSTRRHNGQDESEQSNEQLTESKISVMENEEIQEDRLTRIDYLEEDSQPQSLSQSHEDDAVVLVRQDAARTNGTLGVVMTTLAFSRHNRETETVPQSVNRHTTETRRQEENVNSQISKKNMRSYERQSDIQAVTMTTAAQYSTNSVVMDTKKKTNEEKNSVKIDEKSEKINIASSTNATIVNDNDRKTVRASTDVHVLAEPKNINAVHENTNKTEVALANKAESVLHVDKTTKKTEIVLDVAKNAGIVLDVDKNTKKTEVVIDVAKKTESVIDVDKKTKVALDVDKNKNKTEIVIDVDRKTESTITGEKNESTITGKKTESTITGEKSESTITGEKLESTITQEKTESTITGEKKSGMTIDVGEERTVKQAVVSKIDREVRVGLDAAISENSLTAIDTDAEQTAPPRWSSAVKVEADIEVKASRQKKKVEGVQVVAGIGEMAEKVDTVMEERAKKVDTVMEERAKKVDTVMEDTAEKIEAGMEDTAEKVEVGMEDTAEKVDMERSQTVLSMMRVDDALDQIVDANIEFVRSDSTVDAIRQLETKPAFLTNEERASRVITSPKIETSVQPKKVSSDPKKNKSEQKKPKTPSNQKGGNKKVLNHAKVKEKIAEMEAKLEQDFQVLAQGDNRELTAEEEEEERKKNKEFMDKVMSGDFGKDDDDDLLKQFLE